MAVVSIVKNKQTTAKTPIDLDCELQGLIHAYVAEHSWRVLAANVSSFVHTQFKEADLLIGAELATDEQIDKTIKGCIPSKKYIQDYASGRPICLRYTNTLANFFGKKYTISNHDPYQELCRRLKLL